MCYHSSSSFEGFLKKSFSIILPDPISTAVREHVGFYLTCNWDPSHFSSHAAMRFGLNWFSTRSPWGMSFQTQSGIAWTKWSLYVQVYLYSFLNCLSLSLGHMLPEKSNLRVPMFYHWQAENLRFSRVGLKSGKQSSPYPTCFIHSSVLTCNLFIIKYISSCPILESFVKVVIPQTYFLLLFCYNTTIKSCVGACIYTWHVFLTVALRSSSCPNQEAVSLQCVGKEPPSVPKAMCHTQPLSFLSLSYTYTHKHTRNVRLHIKPFEYLINITWHSDNTFFFFKFLPSFNL